MAIDEISTIDRELPPRLKAILEDIRLKVVEGSLPPGERLPTRLELSRQYGASTRTLHDAITRLIDDGFLRASRRDGTYVAEHPPHLSRYGLVFPLSRARSQESRHWQALVKAASRIGSPPRRVIPKYFGMATPADSESYATLLRDVVGHQVAGLIFSSEPFELVGTPVLNVPGLPRIAVTPAPHLEGVAGIAYDNESYVDLALNWLHQRGRKRLGLFVRTADGRALPPPVQRSRAARSSTLRDRCPEFGMEMRDEWELGVAMGAGRLTQNCVKLLMSSPAAVRPDALIITDDNIVGEVTDGLMAAGVRVPDDLDVVAHTNFPCPPAAAVPVRRLGYDMAAVLDAGIAYIEARRRGHKPAMQMVLPARWEEPKDADRGDTP